MPNSLYAVTAFKIYVIEQLVSNFFETVVARHGDIIGGVACATEHYGIIAVGVVVSGVRDAVQVKLTAYGTAILHSGLVVVVANRVAIQVAALGEYPPRYVVMIIAKGGWKLPTKNVIDGVIGCARRKCCLDYIIFGADIHAAIGLVVTAVIVGDAVSVNHFPPIVLRTVTVTDDTVVGISCACEELCVVT
jgi:hypothetical protein